MSDARKDILEQIRKAGSGRRGKPNHFVKLPDAILWEVYLRMRQGHSCSAVASLLHEHDAAPGTSADSTAKLLLRFKKKISHLLVGSPVGTCSSLVTTRPLPTTMEVNQLVSQGNLAELLELRDLSRQNLHRMLMEEARTGISDKAIAQRQTSLAALEKAVMKLEERESKKPAVLKDYKDKFGRILEGISDPQAMHRAMDRVLQEVDNYIVTLVVDENGNYGVAPQTDAERIRALSFGECGGLGIRPSALDNEKSGGDRDSE